MFLWVLLRRKLTASFDSNYIHWVLVIDGYLYPEFMVMFFVIHMHTINSEIIV